MIEVRPYKPGDVDLMTDINGIYSEDRDIGNRLDGCWDREDVFAYTFMHKGKPVAAAFGEVSYGRMCDLFAVTTDGLKHCGISFFRNCLGLLQAGHDMKGVERFQMTVRSDFAVGARFAEKLGFSREGTMNSFGPDGKTYHLYGRVHE